jgi:hypothetical protein
MAHRQPGTESLQVRWSGRTSLGLLMAHRQPGTGSLQVRQLMARENIVRTAHGHRPPGTGSLQVRQLMARENIIRTAHGTQAAWYRVFTG